MSNEPTKDNSKNSSVEKEFSPTPGMKVYVDTAVRMVGEPNYKIAEEAGIDESTYYKWKKDPRFVDWYVEEYRKRRNRLIPQLDEIALKYAKRGSYNHLELLTKKAGDMPQDQKTQVNIAGKEMSIEFIESDKE